MDKNTSVCKWYKKIMIYISLHFISISGEDLLQIWDPLVKSNHFSSFIITNKNLSLNATLEM